MRDGLSTKPYAQASFVQDGSHLSLLMLIILRLSVKGNILQALKGSRTLSLVALTMQQP